MVDHVILLFYVFLFIQSILGYGIIFSKIVNREFLKLNIGYIGVIGFFFISLISSLVTRYGPIGP